MKKGKILLSLSILAALGSFSAPLSWAADVTNPAKKVNTTVECTGQRILDTKSQKLDVKKLNK